MPWTVLFNSEVGDAFPAMMWTAGPDRTCRWTNRRWLEFTGHSAAEVMGQGWAADIHSDDLDRWRKTYQSAFQAGQGFSLEYRLRRYDGQYRTVVEHVGPGLENGRPAGCYFGFCIDVSHLADGAQERERLLAEAQTANRIKDDFISLVSHGLRTPLNTILMSAQLLAISLPDNAEVSEAAGTITDCVKSQTRLLDELVDTCRVVSGKAQLTLNTVDLAQLAESALTSIATAAAEKGVALTSAIETVPAPLSGDRLRLTRLLGNLLSNGVKFTPAGGSVSLRLRRGGDGYDITVSDTGQGFAAESLPLLFDPNRPREPAGGRSKRSLGLGLAFVRTVAELHGGRATAVSEGPGKGAIFTVTLPLAEAAGER